MGKSSKRRWLLLRNNPTKKVVYDVGKSSMSYFLQYVWISGMYAAGQDCRAVTVIR